VLDPSQSHRTCAARDDSYVTIQCEHLLHKFACERRHIPYP
jgi:hypothetical protein